MLIDVNWKIEGRENSDKSVSIDDFAELF